MAALGRLILMWTLVHGREKGKMIMTIAVLLSLCSAAIPRLSSQPGTDPPDKVAKLIDLHRLSGDILADPPPIRGSGLLSYGPGS